MQAIWSDEGKLARWLDVELAALDGWVEVGAIPVEDVAEIRANAVPPTARSGGGTRCPRMASKFRMRWRSRRTGS